MRRWKNNLLLMLVAGVALAQTASDYVTPEIRRVGDKLACLCGACKNTVATCQMLGCHYASPAREKIRAMQAAGASDQAIVDSFVKEHGLKALAVPPAEGFNFLAWAMPWIAIGMGLCAIYLWVRRFRRPATAAAPEIDPESLARYREQIDKDLAKLD